jgi:DNA gyrase subunit A
MAETIHPVSISQETRRRYLNYALSVIMSRALPDVRDGLKPVQRRILYAMYHDLGVTFDGRPSKCAKIAGLVTGNYHPHGTVPAYEALVRMTQNWVMRVPLVHGQGNFGSVDGDPPAADRYTEAKLTVIAESLMSELKQRTVELRPNYDNTTQEPVVLPAQFPNVLVNGASGIAVGMATNIPPHNLGEVISACVHLIENKDATTAQLLGHIKGPDFPLGGKIITDRKTLRSIYEEGQGSVKVQGEWKLEVRGRKEYIIITSIPYAVEKGKLEEEIGGHINDRKLPQLLSLTNESNEKDGLRIALELRPDADPQLVMAYLYKHTALQQNFACNFTCLAPDENGKLGPQRIGVKEMLRHFLDFRLETVRKRFEYELEQLRRRIHILEGFKIIFDALDRAIRMIRESSGKADAAEKLMKAFKLDEDQTNAILDSQLYKIAQMEIRKILDELREKKKEAAEIEAILASKSRLWTVVKRELTEIGDKFGDRRRSKMATDEDVLEFDPEAYIIRENTNVVLTRDGWIKRVGRLASVESTRVREGDAVLAVAPASTLDHVVIVSDDGTAYTMRVNDVPASSGYGEPISKFFSLDDNVRVAGAFSTDERFVPATTKPSSGDPPGPYLLVATAFGQVLRTPFAPFRVESTKNGRRYARLEEGDRVVLVAIPTSEHKTMFLASAAGHVIHFPISDVNVLAGVGKGVIGIKLADDDRCLGGAMIRNQADAMIVETSGEKSLEFYGSREVVSRAGKGFKAVTRTKIERVLPTTIDLVNWEQFEDGKANGNGKTKDPHRNGKSLFE